MDEKAWWVQIWFDDERSITFDVRAVRHRKGRMRIEWRVTDDDSGDLVHEEGVTADDE